MTCQYSIRDVILNVCFAEQYIKRKRNSRYPISGEIRANTVAV